MNASAAAVWEPQTPLPVALTRLSLSVEKANRLHLPVTTRKPGWCKEVKTSSTHLPDEQRTHQRREGFVIVGVARAGEDELEASWQQDIPPTMGTSKDPVTSTTPHRASPAQPRG